MHCTWKAAGPSKLKMKYIIIFHSLKTVGLIIIYALTINNVIIYKIFI